MGGVYVGFSGYLVHALEFKSALRKFLSVIPAALVVTALLATARLFGQDGISFTGFVTGLSSFVCLFSAWARFRVYVLGRRE